MTEVLGTGTTSTPAVKGLNTGTSPNQGRGVWGESAEHDGVAGYSSSSERCAGYFKNLGDGWGLYSETSGDYTSALWGAASGDSSHGVIGEAAGVSGYGVVAEGPGSAIRSFGDACLAATLVVQPNGEDDAGQFYGDTTVAGDFEVVGWKDFTIDHPLDPANRLLRHSCVEASEPTNFYEGIATADSRGEVEIALPLYFEAINTDIRYQLTALEAPAPNLHVSKVVLNGKFAISGALPNQRVSWQVTGKLFDRASRQRPFVAEVDKEPDERGWYFSPEAHGQPAEKRLATKRFPLPAPRTRPHPPEDPRSR